MPQILAVVVGAREADSFPGRLVSVREAADAWLFDDTASLARALGGFIVPYALFVDEGGAVVDAAIGAQPWNRTLERLRQLRTGQSRDGGR